MKYVFILPVIAILLAPTVLADTNTNTNSNTNSVTSTNTQSTNINGNGISTTTTSHNNEPPHVTTHIIHEHPHTVIVHENTPHVIIVHRSSGGSTTVNNQNIPIVFIKGVGFVAPINCKLTSSGDKIECDFEQVQIN